MSIKLDVDYNGEPCIKLCGNSFGTVEEKTLSRFISLANSKGLIIKKIGDIGDYSEIKIKEK